MKNSVTKSQAQKLLGKQIYAVRKDGTVVSGKLVRISGNQLILQKKSDKKAQTKAIIPLVLFDLLAIGTGPYGYGYPYGGYYGGYPFIW
ncbi:MULTISPECIES: hypothetical protein [unclassified Paenibacillus]|uniref:hypothetical protein n=1 Tax=unclassified Paenibacillus TaxID=185978 RepID=UPI001C115C90|nr:MULTISPECIES: hypothetical protein [unclassified Paenibacillus]MBU5444621.1 hypothetical protein [Paenibacillus sp. MSJ-34]CAH0122032.1 hypothetical protein PAE9249_04570 [Paenibacillus sp. CECT 9249]